MNVHFKNTDDDKIRHSFRTVLERYSTLHPYHIELVQKRIKSSTMQAQPIFTIGSVFGGITKYKVKLAVYVRDSQRLKVSELPESVLVGWFAHELGHIVDYAPYSTLKIIAYGVRYIASEHFKRAVEHKADQIAMDHGFKAEILETKRFILEHDLLKERYKNKIRKYYMPIEQVEAWQHEIAPGIPKAKL